MKVRPLANEARIVVAKDGLITFEGWDIDTEGAYADNADIGIEICFAMIRAIKDRITQYEPLAPLVENSRQTTFDGPKPWKLLDIEKPLTQP